jgi:hypothetical protein
MTMENLAQNPTYEDCQFRMQCLELAARADISHPDAEAIVATAQKFMDFVQGAPKPVS